MYYDDYDDYDDYTAFDARQDAAEDAWQGKVQEKLEPLVDAAFIERTGLMSRLERSLLDEEALTEGLEEDLREQAEKLAEQEAWESQGPCCYQFSCPCGNTNNYRG